MKIYNAKNEAASGKLVVADDMLLTKDMPTTAGSKMLEGYMSLFDAEALTRLYAAGYGLCGKASVGEFAIDLVGETAFEGETEKDGKLVYAPAESIKNGEAIAAVCLDVNGSVRRGAAQSGLVSIKPTYGTVSRYGTIPVACSGETVSVLAANAKDCREILDVISGHDDKDGTSLSDDLCNKLKKDADRTEIKKVAYFKEMTEGLDEAVVDKMNAFRAKLSENGIEVCEIEDGVIAASRVAWNILMSAELCNNVSRYDGVKYGYRTENFNNLDTLYTNSRTEAFGDLLKTAILFGSETLSTDNYMKVYDKALRTRRVIADAFSKIFEDYDAVLLPACSKMAYTPSQVKEDKYISYHENFYTAPASITGLPAVVAEGIQLVGRAFSENALLDLIKKEEK